jgi:hypothetical protein
MRSAAAQPILHSQRLAIADRVGATASLICALHCAALPFVLAVLPTLGLGFLADHLFERIFIACASALALTVLMRGYRQHHDPRALTLLIPGLALLWVGGFLVDGHDVIGLHALLVVLGGSGVALAHLTNLRLHTLQSDV